MGSRGETRAGAAPGWDEHLLDPAWQLRNRSPELALVLGSRLIDQLGPGAGEKELLLAEAAVVVASCRLGTGYEQVERAIRCVTTAERVGADEVGHVLRVELAGCARVLNVVDSAANLLQPALDAPSLSPALRAAALTEAGLCLSRNGWRAELDQALSEADRLYALEPDETVPAAVARASLRAVIAGQHRRRGVAAGAVEVCHAGMELLADRRYADGGRAFARLTLELVLALLDLGRRDDALRAAAAALDVPARAPAVSAVGWLRYALVTRVFQPEGRLERAKELLVAAGTDARRHRLPALLASTLGALTEVHEQTDDPRAAVATLREAQTATVEQRRIVARAQRLLTTGYPPEADATDRLFTRLTEPQQPTRPRRRGRHPESTAPAAAPLRSPVTEAPAWHAEPDAESAVRPDSPVARRATASDAAGPELMDTSWLPDELAALGAMSADGPVDETADRMTDFSSFGLPIPLTEPGTGDKHGGGTHGGGRHNGRHVRPVRDSAGSAAEPAASTESGAATEPTESTVDGSEFSAESSSTTFDAAWQALLGGTGLSKPARRYRAQRDTDPVPPAADPVTEPEPGTVDAAGTADPAADAVPRRRGRGGISELGLVITEGSGGRRRAPEPAQDEEPAQRDPEPSAADAGDDRGGVDQGAGQSSDRAWLESIGYWPTLAPAGTDAPADRSNQAADSTEPGVTEPRVTEPTASEPMDFEPTAAQRPGATRYGDQDGAARRDRTAPETGGGTSAGDAATAEDDTEPAPPIPLRRAGRGRRTNASADDMAELALGELLTEAMLAFHSGATEDTGQRDTGQRDTETRDVEPVGWEPRDTETRDTETREPAAGPGRHGAAGDTRRARREAALSFDHEPIASSDPMPLDPAGAGRHGHGDPLDRHSDAYSTESYAVGGYPAENYSTKSYLPESYRAESYGAESYPAESYAAESYPADEESADRGAHAGGTRPGREWRFSDRSKHGY